MRWKLGIGLMVLHSLWVMLQQYLSNRNMELEIGWVALYRADYPISLLFDWFQSLWTTMSAKYSWTNFVFFFFAGGVQFFAWGFVLGAIADALRRKMKSDGGVGAPGVRPKV